MEAKPGTAAAPGSAGAPGSGAAPPAPGAFHFGPAHMIVHGNAAFLDMFGRASVGQPAREALVDLPGAAFDLMDEVYRTGRPLARQIRTPFGERRLVVAPRRDPENGETYGVTSHLAPARRG